MAREGAGGIAITILIAFLAQLLAPVLVVIAPPLAALLSDFHVRANSSMGLHSRGRYTSGESQQVCRLATLLGSRVFPRHMSLHLSIRTRREQRARLRRSRWLRSWGLRSISTQWF
jgi:hypothetical protein